MNPSGRVVLETDRLLLRPWRVAEGDVIGYCGLLDHGSGPAGEPELAFELLSRCWGRGYATEASLAVVDWARSAGYERLSAMVRDWNTASRRVLAKAGFTETGPAQEDAMHGALLRVTRSL